jgi:hypothetical protein
LLVALPVLALVLLIGGVLVLFLMRSPPPSALNADADKRARKPEVARPHLERAQQLLAQGQFHQARFEADAALTIASSASDLTPAERQTLIQVQKEASLLADLSAESIAEIMQPPGPGDPEWQAVFQRRYLRKAVVFDCEIVRTPEGRYRHTFRPLAGGEEVRLELDGLKVLDGLPLEASRRVILGARLQEVQGEPPGGWVVRLDPGSGVLLTDPDGARLCCHALAEPEARQVLYQQRVWVLGEEAARLVPVRKK